MFRYMRPVRTLFAALTALLMAAGAGADGAARTGDSGGIVLAQARDPLVCCYKRQPGGALLFFLAPTSQCKSSGGREVGMARCRRPNDVQVCCSTPGGFLSMSRRHCRQAGKESSKVRCQGVNGPRVCCATPNGYRTLRRDECAGAHRRPALAVRCSPRALVCCQTTGRDGNITFDLVTAQACKNARGRVAKGRFCRGALTHRPHARGG